MVLHFHPDADIRGVPVLERVLRERRYASQFVTGTGNGGLTATPGGRRWDWEHRIFGGVYDAADPPERPVYGALRLDPDPYGAAPRFGSAYLRLRVEVLQRATFAYPDSVFEPEAFGVADRLGLVARYAADRPADPLDHYIEAHVHGGVRLPEDVEAIVLDPDFAAPEALALAAALGVPVERHPGYRLAAGRLAALHGYRGADAVGIAASLAAGEVLTPSVIGRARRGGREDQQLLKRAWHLLARYGRPWPADQSRSR